MTGAHQQPRRPQLKLFLPASGPDDETPEPSDQMTLRQFFEHWFLPIVLDGAHAATVTAYRESLAWWEQLTGDPPHRGSRHSLGLPLSLKWPDFTPDLPARELISRP